MEILAKVKDGSDSIFIVQDNIFLNQSSNKRANVWREVDEHDEIGLFVEEIQSRTSEYEQKAWIVCGSDREWK